MTIPTNQAGAANIDGFLRGVPTGTIVRLESGEYETAGYWAHYPDAMLRGGLIGTGNTILTMPDPAYMIEGTKPATYYEMLTGGRKDYSASGLRVEGINLQAQSDKPVKALHLWGDRCTVRNVNVYGVAGDRDVLEGEGFGIMVNNGAAGLANGGNVVEDSYVEMDNGYVCGIYVGITHDGHYPAASYVRRCCVRNVGANGKNRAGVGYGINTATVMEDCQVIGAQRAVFSDTGGGTDAIVRRLKAVDCSIGVEFRASGPDGTRERILVDDCDFIFAANPGCYVAGLVLANDAKEGNTVATMRDITFRNCRFFNASGQPGHIGSSQYAADGRQPRFVGCEFRGDWNGDQARAAQWIFTDCHFTR